MKPSLPTAGLMRLSLPRKILFSLGLTVLVTAAAELICAAVLKVEPYHTFTYRERPGGTTEATFALNEHKPSFIIPKPPRLFRVLVFGESAANGTPLVPGGGFPAWLSAMANATGPEQEVEVINLSSNGTNSTLIRDWYERSMEAGPDLVILYIGNNETSTFSAINPVDHPALYRLLLFIRFHSRVYAAVDGLIVLHRGAFAGLAFSSLAEVGQLKTSLQSEARRARVDRVFSANLRYMISAARRAGARVMVVSPAANIRDWPPLKSYHYTQLDQASLAAFAKDMDEAQRALAASDPDGAAKALSAALALDPKYAEAHYLYAKVREQKGDIAGALKHYEAAREWEDFSLRSAYRFDRLTREAAEAGGAAWFDLETALARRSAHGIPGFDMFYDSVHFKLMGQYEAALELFEELKRLGMIPAGPGPLPEFGALRSRLTLEKQTIYSADLYVGIFLGFYFQAPELHREAIADFQACRPGFPNDAFPVLAQAGMEARLHDPGMAARFLSEAASTSLYATQVSARRYFPGLLEIYQDQAVMGDLSGKSWAKAALFAVTFRESKKISALGPLEFGKIPLDKMSMAWVFDEAGKRFADATPVLQALQREQRQRGGGEKDRSANLLALSRNSLHPAAMSADWSNNMLVAQGSDSYLVISPWPADPLFSPTLRIKATFSSQTISDNWMVIYWAGARSARFEESKKLMVFWPIDNRERDVEIPLGRILPLLMDRPLSALRLDFTAQPAEIHIDKLELLSGAR